MAFGAWREETQLTEQNSLITISVPLCCFLLLAFNIFWSERVCDVCDNLLRVCLSFPAWPTYKHITRIPLRKVDVLLMICCLWYNTGRGNKAYTPISFGQTYRWIMKSWCTSLTFWEVVVMSVMKDTCLVFMCWWCRQRCVLCCVWRLKQHSS